MKSSRTASVAAAVLAGVLLPAQAPAQEQPHGSPEKAIKARQSGYYLMGAQMARINATLKGDLPFDQASLALSAEALELLGRIVTDHYPPGSDQGNTRAKGDVWKDASRFRELAAASQGAAVDLKTAVHGGDLRAIKTAYGAASKSCKACHDVFKSQ
jgi:cytochrome c556